MPDSTQRAGSSNFDIRFPETAEELDQDEEWFEVRLGDRRERLRIHDYDTLYRIPGLYEALVYGELGCRSPDELSSLFREVLRRHGQHPGTLRVLDLGAGNGVVAEALSRIGVNHFVGLDLLLEAKIAAKRDRPDVYADYLVADLEKLKPQEHTRLDEHHLNTLICVAALGFGDIPPKAFATAFNTLTWKGWLALTIKDDFLRSGDESGYARLLGRMIRDEVIIIEEQRRYCHRRSVTGQQLHYLALVARKACDIPRETLGVNDKAE